MNDSRARLRAWSVAISALMVAALGVSPAVAVVADPVPSAGGAGSVQPGQPNQLAEVSDPDAEPSTVLVPGPANKARTYVVQLDGAAVPGRVPAAGARRTPSASAWRSSIKDDQAAAKAAIGKALGVTPKVGYTFTEALNGFTLTLTGKQAAKVAQLDGIAAVTVDQLHHLTSTSYGTDWIGSPAVWSGAPTAAGAASGEGITVGFVDSGINPANPSFAATVPVSDGGDGYVHVNPRGAGNYLGMCDPDYSGYVPDWGCNDKLIGAYNFTTLPVTDYPAALSPYDDLAHGSHVASTAVGNQTRATWPGLEVMVGVSTMIEPKSEQVGIVAGVAPHANLISYDVCASNSYQGNACNGSDMVRAIEQAIVDGVDVLNLSLGSSAVQDPWTEAVSQALLNARKAGVSVAQSAGNSGPGDASITSYGDVPWLTSVANTSHDLGVTPGQATFSLGGLDAEIGPFTSKSISGNLAGSHPMVLASGIDSLSASDPDNGLCVPGSLAPGVAAGKVLICDRGKNDRVSKGRVARDSGAVGMILANTADNQSLPYDLHVLPAVHLSNSQGAVLKTALAARPSLQVEITGGALASDPANADVVAVSSSRGPAQNGSHALGPSLSAPGTDVLAAGGTNNDPDQFQVMTGTSMSSPHVAGAMALLGQLNPNWTPAQIQSALMTTARTAVKDHDGTPATWFEMGSGRVDLPAATRAGLLLDSDPALFESSNPAAGGDPRDLNTAQISNASCILACTSSRTVTATANGLGEWTAAVTSSSPDLRLALNTKRFTLASVGQSQRLTVTATVPASSSGNWLTGTLTLTPPARSKAPAAHLPIAIKPNIGGVALEMVTSSSASGTHKFGTVELPYSATSAAFKVSKPTPVTVMDRLLAVDASPYSPYDSGSGSIDTVTVAAGTRALIVEIGATTSPDIDLMVGTGSTPSETTAKCTSAEYGSVERCIIAKPDAGEWWILVQNYTASSAGTDRVGVEVTQVVSGLPSSTHLTARATPVMAQGKIQPLTLNWSAPLMPETGSGWVVLDVTSPGKASFAGFTKVTRTPSAIEVAPLPTDAVIGDVVTPEVTVSPVGSGDEPDREVAVELPSGWTADPGTINAGGTVATTAGVTTVTWRGTQPELEGRAGVVGPAPLTFAATVARPAREGATVNVVTRDTIRVPAGTSTSEHLSGVRVVGGVYPSVTTLKLATANVKPTEPAVVTARVAGAALAAPTGTVEFSLAGQVVATIPISDGAATIRLEGGTLALGRHSITASYSGDETNTASSAAAVTLTVANPPSVIKPKPVVKKAVAITVKPAGKVRRGKKAQSLVVRVAASGVAPRGTVTIRAKGAGKTIAKRVTEPASGVVKMKLAKYRKVGKVTVTVAYLGDAKTLARTVKKSFRVRK